MKALFIFVMGLFAASIVHASPFLVSDPYPVGAPQPDEFIIMQIGKPARAIPAFKNADGTRMLKLDLADMPVGKFEGTIKAASGIWGDSATVPFSLFIGLTSPANIKVIP